jgi:hypothetical protein
LTAAQPAASVSSRAAWLEDSFDYGAAVIKEQTDQTMLETAAETRFDPFRASRREREW